MRAGGSTVSADKKNRGRCNAEATVKRFRQSLRSEAGAGELRAGLARVVATIPESGYVSLGRREKMR